MSYATNNKREEERRQRELAARKNRDREKRWRHPLGSDFAREVKRILDPAHRNQVKERDRPISRLLLVEAEVAAVMMNRLVELEDDGVNTISEKWWRGAYQRVFSEFLSSHAELTLELARWAKDTIGVTGTEFHSWLTKEYLDERRPPETEL